VPGSIGTPIDLVEMKIVDTETGQQCAVGELGEIAIRGPNVMLGYWNRPQDTKDAIRDGWFHSGDVGRCDARGYFYIVDRVKDMISVGAQKVYPAEVERVLLDHADVSQVAVVGVPEAVFGEQVVAFVVLHENAQANEHAVAQLLRHAKSNLAHYKVPRKIVPIDELPRNPSGKVLKTLLRQFDFQDRKVLSDDETAAIGDKQNVSPMVSTKLLPPTLRKQLEAAHAASRQRIANSFVQQLVQQISDSEELPSIDARFLDVGLDSLMMVEISSQIQVEIGPQHEVPATLVFDHPRICDLADYLVTALQPERSPSEADRPGSNDVTRGSQQPPSADSNRRQEIAWMTEDEALAALERELETNH
jgi:long-chain acyl-CoA synthetase